MGSAVGPQGLREPRVSVVVPARDEAANLPAVLADLQRISTRSCWSTVRPQTGRSTWPGIAGLTFASFIKSDAERATRCCTGSPRPAETSSSCSTRTAPPGRTRSRASSRHWKKGPTWRRARALSTAGAAPTSRRCGDSGTGSCAGPSTCCSGRATRICVTATTRSGFAAYPSCASSAAASSSSRCSTSELLELDSRCGRCRATRSRGSTAKATSTLFGTGSGSSGSSCVNA